ncbi:7 transmembrane receptor (rhodopsin) [Halocaridina rubra]|uniref:7 transmembrane receptor (Rhodopsin) n=1 Tax=Halocaridina rubra TaxID=373956 RepID=A0AAN8WWA2_HALRR
MAIMNTANFTLDATHREPAWITGILLMYYIPVIALVGIIGNIISMVVFLGTRLRNHSSSYYLAAMAASDTLFLVFLFVQWLHNNQSLQWLRIEALNTGAGCKMINYVMSTCASISVWLTVAYTAERCIAVQYPLLRASLCTVGRAKIVITIITIVNTVAYLYMFTTIGRPDEFDNCGFYKEYLQVMVVVSVLEAFVMVALPFLMIFFMNLLIVWKLWKLSNVFHANETRNSSSRTCDGTADTPLTPSPKPLPTTQSNFSQNSTPFEDTRQTGTNSPVASFAPEKPCAMSDSDSKQISKQVAETIGEIPALQQRTIKRCRPTANGEANTSSQYFFPTNNINTERSVNTVSVHGDAPCNVTAALSETSTDHSSINKDDIRQLSNKGTETQTDLCRNDSSNSFKNNVNNTENLSDLTSGESTTKKGQRAEETKNGKNEKVFIDVNIRVIIDNSNNISSRNSEGGDTSAGRSRRSESPNQDRVSPDGRGRMNTLPLEDEKKTRDSACMDGISKDCKLQNAMNYYVQQKSKGMRTVVELQPVTNRSKFH